MIIVAYPPAEVRKPIFRDFSNLEVGLKIKSDFNAKKQLATPMQGSRKNIRVDPIVRFCSVVLLSAVCAIFAVSEIGAENDAAIWKALQSGDHFALLRHAIAPGTGDPPHFAIGNCATQRNLSDKGREQAKKIGVRFRENGIHAARVFSSQWCRCLETAELLSLGPVRELSILNSFFRRPEFRDSRTRMLKEWLAGQDPDQPVVLVTHQVNITALTGIYPASGEVLIVRRHKTGEFSVAGRIETD